MSNQIATNIFEQASRLALRFPTARGEISTEQLWGLPLDSTVKPSLNSIALEVDAELSTTATKSFVATVSPNNKVLNLKMDILKHVIKIKQDENAAKETRQVNATKRRALEDALARKQAEKIDSASEEELQAQLAALPSE